MNKYRKLLLIVSLVVCTGLTACGDDKKTSNKGATPTDAVGNNTEGYVDNMQQTVSTEAAQVDEAGFVVVDDWVKTVGETINVRVEPSTSSSIYTMLEPEVKLPRSGYNNEWARVRIDGAEYFIYGDYVVPCEPPENISEYTEDNDTEDGEDEEIPKEKNIVIDPGNQANMNATPEYIGPGNTDTKVGVNTGVMGVGQSTPEYTLNLTYARALREELQSRGYTVTLTRENDTDDVTNMQRARIANNSGATAMVRIKMNYSTNAEMKGIMAATMTSDSPYNSDLYEESHELATRVLQGIVEITGAENHGIYETNDMTSINWCKIPVCVINLGYLSNADEEAILLDPDYQKKVIKGLADGIDFYINN